MMKKHSQSGRLWRVNPITRPKVSSGSSNGVFAFLVMVVLAQLACPVWAGGEAKGKILFLASNLEDMGDPGKHDARNNLWEYAPPYHVFVSHGYEVNFATPRGGRAPFMMDPIGISSYAIKYEGFLDRSENSLSPDLVNPDDYVAVFVGGGYGTLFDVAGNEAMLSLVAAIYESGGVVGGCGHGPGAFANVTLSDGSFMVSGKRVAAFPNSTEIQKTWAEQGSLLPFMVEDRLRKNGALVINKENVEDKTVVIADQRIVSTMFLPSAALVAREMVDLLDQRNTRKIAVAF